MKILRPKLNLVELALLGFLVAALAFAVGGFRKEVSLRPYITNGAAELGELERRYGPSRNSRHGEEWIIRDFFKDRRGGVFVDVGANHYKSESNTHYVDVQLGWSGIAIEPQLTFAADYAKYRPRTRFVPLFVSDVSNRETTLFVPPNNLMASADREFASTNGAVTPVRTTTTTLDDILDRSGITRVDLLSMDIELGEPAALAGFSIGRFRPELVGVEAHPPVRQQVLDYFARNGYVPVGRYWLADSENFWFTPLTSK